MLRSSAPGLIGGIHTLAYDPDETVYPHYNMDLSAVEAYCEVMDDSPLPGSIMRYSLLEVVDRDSGQPISQYGQIELELFDREQKLIYMLYVYTDEVSKATFFDIMDSIKLKHSEGIQVDNQ